MFRATVSPIFRSTLTVYTAFWNNVPTQLSAAFQSVSPVGSRQQSQYIVPKSSIYIVKVLMKTGETVAETCRASLKESIKQILLHLLVADIIVLVMHGHTNVTFAESFKFRENRPSEKRALFKGINIFSIRTSRIQYTFAARFCEKRRKKNTLL